jgi:hypothetical protein
MSPSLKRSQIVQNTARVSAHAHPQIQRQALRPVLRSMCRCCGYPVASLWLLQLWQQTRAQHPCALCSRWP